MPRGVRVPEFHAPSRVLATACVEATMSKSKIPKDRKNPWHHAGNREHITPEDIGAAIAAGADKVALMTCVLNAIANRCCEDVTTSAFTAVNEWDDPMPREDE